MQQFVVHYEKGEIKVGLENGFAVYVCVCLSVTVLDRPTHITYVISSNHSVDSGRPPVESRLIIHGQTHHLHTVTLSP